MQKLINNEWFDIADESELIDGDIYRISVGNGGWQQQTFKSTVEKPVIEVTGIQITGASLNGSIYWIAKDSPVTITANVSLPDGQLMAMVERVVDATVAVDDFRTIATISGEVMTMSFKFPLSGNYIFRCKRLNEGLDRITAAFNLSFEDVEFDVYV